jgi:hypothetical protein
MTDAVEKVGVGLGAFGTNRIGLIGFSVQPLWLDREGYLA